MGLLGGLRNKVEIDSCSLSGSPPFENPKQKWRPSSLKLPNFAPRSNNSSPRVRFPAKVLLVRVPRAVMVLYQVLRTVVCTVGSPRRPSLSAPARIPSPVRQSLSTRTPLGRRTPSVPYVRPTGTAWILVSLITSLRVPPNCVKYYVTMRYVV